MGLFDALFGRKKAADAPYVTNSAPRERESRLGVLVAVRGQPELDPASIAKRLARLEAPGAPVEFEMLEVAGRLSCEGQVVDFVMLDAPIPAPLVDSICQVTHWADAAKATLRKHQRHYICWYGGESEDPTEQYLALLKAGWCLSGSAMTGVILEDAVNFLPPELVQQLFTEEMLESVRESVPVNIFTGFIKFFAEHGTWCATRGHHIYGLPDFALFAPPDVQPSEVNALFGGLFNYAYGAGVSLNAGETMELGGQFYRFEPVVEYKDYIEGPGETIVLSPFEPS